MSAKLEISSMSAGKNSPVFALISAMLAIGLCQNSAIAASNEKLPLTVEEMTKQRRAVREELMLPSLSGIRSIAYRVVGFKDYAPLEKVMANKLAELKIPCDPLVKVGPAKKSFDAIVQISFTRLGLQTIGEIKVIQWANLERDPKLAVRAVTYGDKTVTLGNPEKAVEQLTSEFVLDYLKANQKGFGAAASSGNDKTKAKSDPKKAK